MELVKNFICLVLSTVVWLSGIVIPASVWWGIKEQDGWYLFPLLISLCIVVSAILAAKHNPRLKAALEIPMGLLG